MIYVRRENSNRINICRSIDMIHRCTEKYGDRCEILSAIPSAKKNILYAEEDKRAWVAEYISPEKIC